MALFRFHRGSLEESLKTTIIVKDIHDLLERLAEWWEEAHSTDRSTMKEWQVHIDIRQQFDERCGWFTHTVSFRVGDNESTAIGFLSEPLDQWNARS